jgi:hypothetical protein
MKRLALLFGLALATPACTRSQMIDMAMQSAKHPSHHEALRVGDREVLAGDMHCHILPPDSPAHVTRELPETLARAADQDLDFLVLTPHVPIRFFADPGKREWVLRTQDELAARIAALRPAMIVVPGFEYTDHHYGHVGAAFADVRTVLADVSVEDAAASPARFFEAFVARGGVLTINHPVERPLPRSPFWQLRADLSWRAFAGDPVPPEIAWLTTHAQTIEIFNASITHLRDQFILGDEERSMREAASIVDRVSKAQGRRVAAVGGSDSHGSWLRPTTYVLAKAKTREAVRDALVEGRTCVRGPEACTLEVAAPDGPWHSVGEALDAVGAVRARARGGDVTFIVDGAPAATARDGEVASIPIAPRCSEVRAIVGMSWSSAIYVNCAWAQRASRASRQNVPPTVAIDGVPSAGIPSPGVARPALAEDSAPPAGATATSSRRP